MANNNKKILCKLRDELQSDIKKLEEYINSINDILKNKKIILDELDDDIANAIHRMKNKNFALIEDILILENKYNINIDYNQINKCITQLDLKVD